MKHAFIRYFKTLKRGMRRLLYKTYLRFGIYINNSDAQYLHIFNRAVKDKIVELGLENSKFTVPSGASADENYSTGRDILRMMAFSTQYTYLQTILGAKIRDICVKGKNARKMTIENTVPYSIIGGIYPIVSSKTGSWGTDWFNLAVVTKIDNKRVIGVVIGAVTDEDRYTAMKELLDISDAVLKETQSKTTKGSVTKAPIAIAAVMQADGSNEIFYEKNADEKCNPASLTKMMTAMVVFDHIDNFNEELTYKYIDMCRCAGLVNVDDILSVEDALYDMLLPSSNQSAQALARFTGKKILQKDT